MKVIYNSKIAKIFLPNFKAILLGFVLLCKKAKEFYDEEFFRHEGAHSYQWQSLCLFGIGIFGMISLLFMNFWILLLSPITFYLWYVIEWLIRFIGKIIKTPPVMKFGFKAWWKGLCDLNHESYRDLSFEKEARATESGIYEPAFLSFCEFY